MLLTHTKKSFNFIQPNKILILSSSRLKKYLDIINCLKNLQLNKFDTTDNLIEKIYRLFIQFLIKEEFHTHVLSYSYKLTTFQNFHSAKPDLCC